MLYSFQGSTINIVNDIWGIGLAGMALWLLHMQKRRAPETRILFKDLRWMFVLNALATFCDLLGTALDGTSSMIGKVFLHLGDGGLFYCNSLLLFSLAMYILHNIDEDIDKEKWSIFFGALCGVHLLFVTGNIFHHWIYYIDEFNVYHRGELFALNHVIAMTNTVVAVFLVIRYWEFLRKRTRKNIVFLLVVPTLAQILQVLIYGIGFIYIAETMALMLILISLYNYNIEMQIEQNEQITKNYLASMISQIQPHFLYNVLMAIMGIEGNPPETKKALADFGKYLRGNMDILRSTEPISFVKEMQHVEAYVNLEKLRFQENLTVEYDLQVKDFEISALAVQMLVENAIKHGIRPKGGHGTVVIETRELPDYFRVRVIDDGIGFDDTVPKDTSRSHVGLENTRERLRMMVDAELTVTSVINHGTVASIMIPKVDYDEYFSG